MVQSDSSSSNEEPRVLDILLVEDEEADVEIFRRSLRKSKLLCNLNVVNDGVEAIDYLRKRGMYEDALRPDIIILDLNMPRMNGREVLQEIKADPVLLRIPVVVMTSSAAEEDITKSYELHANCYIRKPVELDQIQKIVNSLDSFWLSIVSLPPY